MEDKKYNYSFKNSVLIFILVFAVHSVISIILRQAIKLAVFSEVIGIVMSLAVVFGIMTLIYFLGRKLIIKKKLVSVKTYYILSAFIPAFMWFIIAIFKVISALNSVDAQEFSLNQDIIDLILYLFRIFRTVNSTLNSVITALSSSMVFIVASLFEIFSFNISKLLKKRVKNSENISC